MAAISHDDAACKNPLLPNVRSRRLVFYRGENQKIPRSSVGSLRLPVDCIAFQLFRPPLLPLPIASTWCHGGVADHGVRGEAPVTGSRRPGAGSTGGCTLHHQRHAPREAEGLRWCLGALCMGMSMSRRNMTVGSNSDGADQSL